MKPWSYFELRSAVLETFYEALVSDGHTVGQAAGRCLVEFRGEAQDGGQNALVVLGTVLARVARHDPAALARLAPEISALRGLERKSKCWRGMTGVEKERAREDLRFALEKATEHK
jgi:hypothetical protein